MYRFERGESITRDLEAIYDFLFGSYVSFGEFAEDAAAAASDRVARIEIAMEALAARPHQGTLRPDFLPGLRSVTKDRAVFYFTVDEEARVVRVLAVFFGGQDHQREMLKRLRSGG
jgi:plasmid stabilization system protein ParE